MTKAYKSPEFIDSPDARPLRILAEYMEPEKRLRENHIHRAITFWGSARIQPGAKQVADGRDYYQLASDLAQKLAHWTHHNHPAGERFHVLTGAGGGIMEAAHAGAAQVDKRLNVGLNISLPFEQKPNPSTSEVPAENLNRAVVLNLGFVGLDTNAIIQYIVTYICFEFKIIAHLFFPTSVIIHLRFPHQRFPNSIFPIRVFLIVLLSRQFPRQFFPM